MPRPKDPAVETLDRALKERTREGVLYQKLEDEKLLCFACGHRCVIHEGLDGICRVRFNRGGTLYVPRGYVGALQIDPIEKKPFFHALPGTNALSFGMLGCDYHCPYCLRGDTPIATSAGPIPIGALWESSPGYVGDSVPLTSSGAACDRPSSRLSAGPGFDRPSPTDSLAPDEGASVRYPEDLFVFSHTGRRQRVVRVFRHPY